MTRCQTEEQPTAAVANQIPCSSSFHRIQKSIHRRREQLRNISDIRFIDRISSSSSCRIFSSINRLLIVGGCLQSKEKNFKNILTTGGINARTKQIIIKY